MEKNAAQFFCEYYQGLYIENFREKYNSVCNKDFSLGWLFFWKSRKAS